MPRLFDAKAPRRPVNLTLNGDLVARAREHKLNLSALAEEAITAALARINAARFQEEIARGVAEHDAYLDAHGSLGEAIRAMGETDGDG